MIMEAIEEPPVTNVLEEDARTSNGEIDPNAQTSEELDVCHTSNGLTDFTESVELKHEQNTDSVVVETTAIEHVDELVTKFEEDYDNVTEAIEAETAQGPSGDKEENPKYIIEVMETETGTEIQEAESTGVEYMDDDNMETEVVEESVVEVDGIVDNNAGNITFETEIFIENNDSELDETITCNDSSNILSELGQNIEMSEVLRSSDVSETVENNNCEQEVFNKEELLDILEGNDVEESRKMISENFHEDSKKLEEHLAMQQLNRLKTNDCRKKNRISPKKPEKKQPKRNSSSYVPRETRARADETANSTTPSKEVAKLKVDESTFSKIAPKESKSKQDDTANSKMLNKESKGKVDNLSGAKVASKEPKEKEDESASTKISKEKVEDIVTPKVSKEAKKKVDDSASSKTPKDVKGKVNDILSTKITLKKREDNITISKIAPKEGKGKVEDVSSSKVAHKESKGKGNDSDSSNSIPKEEKRKVDETDSSCIAPTEVKDKEDILHVPKAMKKKVNEIPKKDSIVNALVQDWSDDENMEPSEPNTLLDESEALLESTEELTKSQEALVQDETNEDECHPDVNTESIADVSTSEETTPNNKSVDDSQPQRRLGRVIKKKVIYDPDNPDTFTKTKVHIKKEKEVSDKEQSAQPTPKKLKTEHPPQVPKIKSPVSKMHWKKPSQPKNSKQSSKRLTEIDKLLMDEGAVNMICQLTPEALKGNKNMKSKAEFIKNIQSNTPDTKEMKFRERKSKLKSEDDPRKPGSGKHRLSLSSSVKSPAISDDFENHSADDSIIYRRHSSSSYSSSCMSPRRLSDVESAAIHVAHRESQQSHQEIEEPLVQTSHVEVFVEEKTPRRSIMNKSDCLSIKEKLNSKLSQALNKRKLSGFKPEKPSKIKKVIQAFQNEEVSTDVTVNFNHKVAEICIHKAGSLFNIQIMKILQKVLSHVDSNKDTTVTLITSECGSICSGLDLSLILEDVNNAYEIADQARSLMRMLESHSKFLIVGVEGKTRGFSLALATLCDVLLASENATFALYEGRDALLQPGAGVLSSRALPQNLLNDLIVFGKELSSSDALQGGLVSRVVWPDRFQEQVRAIAKDIADQPFENIMLKKQLIGLKKSAADSTFQTCLDKERDLLVNYWTSEDGLLLLRANLNSA